MKTLYLLRHAKSSWKYAQLEDILRPLNKEGQEEVQELTDKIQSCKLFPEVIYCSPAIRTYQTAFPLKVRTGMADGNFRLIPELYHASLQTWSYFLSSLPETEKEVLVCGHNNGISDILSVLMQGNWKEIPTGTLVALSVPCKWKDIIEKKSGLLYTLIPSRHGYETL